MQQARPLRATGIAQISLAGFAFGFLGVFGKLATRANLSVGELLTYRFLLAATILALFLAVFSPRKLRLTFKDLIGCAALGVTGYAVFATLYFTAIEGASIAVASLLLYTFPVIVALGAHVLFKEKLSLAQWIALPLAALGLMVLLGIFGAGNTSAKPLAIAAGLGSAACYAFYILASSRIQKSVDPVTSGVYVMLFAGLGLLIANRPDVTRIATFDLNQVLIVLGIAVVCTILPLVMFLAGLQKLGNTEASLLSTVEPVTAAIVGSLIMGESLATQELLGGALVIAALFVTVLGNRSSSRRVES